MIPKEVADVRDILMEQYSLPEYDATDIAWALYRAKLLKSN